jgi:hypothetical protein
MEAKDSLSATIDTDQQTNWLKSGCAYGIIATQNWKEAVGKICRKDVINSSPETRAMLLAASIIHNPNSGETCRMILVANEYGRVNNFEYYSKVLWLIYAQTLSPVIKTRIILALGIAPKEHLEILYEQELSYCEQIKKNYLGRKEAMDFSRNCAGIIQKGAKESLLSKKDGMEKILPTITEVIDSFFAATKIEKSILVLN